MKRTLAILLTLSLLLGLLPTQAWSQGPCSVFRTWITGDSLTAGDLNSSFSTVGVTNMEFSCVDDMSGSIGEMQGTTDPAPAAVESLATSGNGEIQRLRFMFARMLGLSQWYQHTDNVNFATGTSIQGSGLGRHVTAVGYHAWSGWRTGTPPPAQFPAITSIADHWTGLAFPARGHISVVIGDVVNEGGGVKGGVELIRIHALGTIYHHTAALMFAHSMAFSAGAGSSAGHITAISVSRGVTGTDALAPGRDTLLFGHAGTVMQMVGSGASHITLGSRSYIALGRHVGTLPTAPVANALYGSTIPKAWINFDGSGGNMPVNDSFNVASVTDNGAGDATIAWDRDFADSSYAPICSIVPVNTAAGAATRICFWVSLAATSAVLRTGFVDAGGAINFEDQPLVFILVSGNQ